MTTYTIDAPPVPSDFELEALDRRNRDNGEPLFTLAQFCIVFLHLDDHNPTRIQFARDIEAKCDRVEARGVIIHYPLRRTRFEWYADWNLFEARDARQTEMGARYAGTPQYSSR